MIDNHKISGKSRAAGGCLKNRKPKTEQCLDPCFVEGEPAKIKRKRKLVVRKLNKKPSFEWLDNEEIIPVLEENETNTDTSLLSEKTCQEDINTCLEDGCCGEEDMDFLKSEGCHDDIEMLLQDECCEDGEYNSFFEGCGSDEDQDFYLNGDCLQQSNFKGKLKHGPCGKPMFLHQDLKRLIGCNILLVTKAEQLVILGRAFRPVFYGKVIRVNHDAVTLFPVQMHNAPKYNFTTPLSFPLVNVVVTAPLRG